jgi:hypothetical protein
MFILSIIIEKEGFEVDCLYKTRYHIRTSALTTADRRPPSWNRITDSTHAPPVGNGIGVIFMLSIIIKQEDFEVNCLYKTRWDSYPGIG